MTSIETGEYKKLLEAERGRLRDAVDFLEKENAGSVEEELGEISGRGDDNHLADMATATYDRELDEGLEEGRAADARRGRRSPAADRGRKLRRLRGLRRADRRRAPVRDPLDAALHRRRPPPRVTDVGSTGPARSGGTEFAGSGPNEVRVGSTTNGLRPVSVAERSVGAGAWQWAGLAAVAVAAIVADQVTKHVVTSTLSLDQSEHVVGPLSIHHVQNSGIAFGLFSSATAIVTAVTAGAVIWMVVFFARSGARHPVLPAALGLLIGGSISNLVDRIRLHHVTDFIDLKWWPAFNLADSFIVVGVAILLGALIVADRTPKPPRRTLDVAAR